MTKELPRHLPWLDGVRGIAALWVVLHHVHILVGAPHVPVLSWGALAVDLFMMVSGFLMAHHYLLSRERAPWEAGSTWRNFWARRWFRLSPLYYVLLAVALAAGPLMAEYRANIASLWPQTATPAERYTDASLANIAAHLSYAFGAIPVYSFKTVLPDWSIGLEAQFYLAFPFMMLAMARFGPMRAGFAMVAVCIGFRVLFPDFFRSFPMPSFLPIKLYVFVIGIWLALSQRQRSPWPLFAASAVVALIYVASWPTAESVARVLVVAGMFLIVHSRGAVRDALAGALSGRVSRFLGDMSYAVYLVHLLIVLPMVAWLISSPQYLGMHWLLRFLVAGLLVMAPVYGLAYVLFRLIEQPGIALGKRLLKRRQP